MKKHTILLFIGFLLAQTVLFSQREDSLFSKVLYNQAEGIHVLASVKAGQDSLMMVSIGEYGNNGGIQLIDDQGVVHWSKKLAKNGSNLMPVDLIRTEDQHFLICVNETTYNPTNLAILIVKINLEGETLWVKRFNVENGASASGMVLSASGDILITGLAMQSVTSYDSKLLLLRITNEGALVWSKTYKTATLKDRGLAVAELITGDLVIGGLTKGINDYSTEFAITKTDAAGNLLWAKKRVSSGTSNNSVVNDLMASPTGFYLSGYTWDAGGFSMSFNEDGEIIWSKVFDHWFDHWFDPIYRGRIAKTTEGDLLLSYGAQFSPGFSGRLNGANGAIIWSKEIAAQQIGMQQLSDGGYLFIGLGPMLGVKDLYMPHTGLIRTNEMGEAIDCLWDFSIDTRDYIVDFTSLTYDIADVGTMVDDVLQWNEYSYDIIDGCVDISGAVDEAPDATKALTVYPNPGKAPFRLMLEEVQPESQAQLLIYDSKGQAILNREGIWIELQLIEKQLPRGIYLIQVRTKNGVFAAQLVVE